MNIEKEIIEIKERSRFPKTLYNANDFFSHNLFSYALQLFQETVPCKLRTFLFCALYARKSFFERKNEHFRSYSSLSRITLSSCVLLRLQPLVDTLAVATGKFKSLDKVVSSLRWICLIGYLIYKLIVSN